MTNKIQSETNSAVHFKVVAFGRHEIFAPHYGWLIKGYQLAYKDPKIFDTDKTAITLGVGVNMVRGTKFNEEKHVMCR